jgi:hypothetical protein
MAWDQLRLQEGGAGMSHEVALILAGLIGTIVALAIRGIAVRRNPPNKTRRLLSDFIVSAVLFGLGIITVFVYIPFISDNAFWFVVAAYFILAFGYLEEIKGR